MYFCEENSFNLGFRDEFGWSTLEFCRPGMRGIGVDRKVPSATKSSSPLSEGSDKGARESTPARLGLALLAEEKFASCVVPADAAMRLKVGKSNLSRC